MFFTIYTIKNKKRVGRAGNIFQKNLTKSVTKLFFSCKFAYWWVYTSSNHKPKCYYENHIMRYFLLLPVNCLFCR